MSLRRILWATIAVLGFLAAGALTFIVASTTRLNRLAAEVDESINRVRVVEELEVALVRHASVRNRLHASADPSLARLTLEIERQLRRQLEQMKEAVRRSEEDAAIVKKIDERVRRYLESHATSAGAQVKDSARVTVDEMNVVLTELESLGALNVKQTQAASEAAINWVRFASLGGVIVAALLIACAIALAWMTAGTIRPAIEVAAAMERFGGGDHSARAREHGAVEVQSIARTFNTMADTLQREHERRLTFIAGVAHDLRNPIGVLKMSAALTHKAPLAEDAARRAWEKVERQVNVLDRMVSDLLDAVRVEAGHLELQTTRYDVRELLIELRDTYATVGSHEIHVAVPAAPLFAEGDPVRIGQVLQNLVSNAVKYSPSRSRIDIATREDAGGVAISVRDEGAGIAAEDLERIFEPFHRSRDTASTIPGTGLGLSVARRIARAHGGDILVDSRLGAGSTFTVRLPADIDVAEPSHV